MKRTWRLVDHRAGPGQSEVSSFIPHLWNVCFAHCFHVRSWVQECSLERRMCCWDYLDWICDWTWKIEDRNFYHFLLDSQVYLLSYRAAAAAKSPVVSDSVQPQRWQPTRLPRSWDSPGKNTGVGCHFPLQCMKVKSERQAAQSCPTLSNPMDCSPPDFSIHGIFQAKVLEWGAIAFSVL